MTDGYFVDFQTFCYSGLQPHFIGILKVKVFVYLFVFNYFHSLVHRNSNIVWTRTFFLIINTRPGLPTWIMSSLFISNYQRNVCVSFSWTDSGLWKYHLVVQSNFSILYKSCTHFVLVWCIYLLSDCQFCIVIHITYVEKLFLIINFRSDVIGPYRIVVRRYLKRFSFSFEISLL